MGVVSSFMQHDKGLMNNFRRQFAWNANVFFSAKNKKKYFTQQAIYLSCFDNIMYCDEVILFKQIPNVIYKTLSGILI